MATRTTTLKNHYHHLLVPALTCIIFICLNVLGGEVARISGVNLYLDCVGTILAAIFGGFVPAVACGYLSNFLSAAFDPSAIYYSAVSVFIGLAAAGLASRGFFKRPLKCVVSILALSLISTVTSSLISWFLYGLDSTVTSDAAYAFVASGLGPFAASVAANLSVEVVDKAITVLIALIIAHFIPDSFSEAARIGFWQQQPLSKDERNQIQYHDTRRVTLRAKMLLIITVVLFSVIGVVTTISFRTYNESMIEEEISVAKGVLKYLVHEIDPNMVDDYINRGEQAPGYIGIETKMIEIRESFPRVEYVYAYRIEKNGCRVVFDPDTPDLPGADPGDLIGFDMAFEDSLDDLKKGNPIDPIISNEEYGWLLTMYQPVYNRTGKCVCYVCIDISMNDIMDGGRQFVAKVLALFGAFFILACTLVMWLSEYAILFPLNSITNVMRHFAFDDDEEDDGTSRHTSLQSLVSLNIHTGDEVELLYDAVVKTAGDMVSYIDMTEAQNETISRMQENLIMVMADLVESRDKFTGDHVKKTAAYCQIIMGEMKKEGIYDDELTDEFMWNVFHSAPLHDIGKITVPDAILNKPGRLTEEEFEIMKSHTTAGRDILEQAVSAVSEPTYLDEAKNLAEYHHEKWAGGGYPTGISGTDIPLSARIMAVADVFDALVSKRSYKEGFPLAKAYAIIEEGAGTHFDPLIAQAFLNAKDQAELVCRAYGDGQTDKEDAS